jgi:hypothetical protein
MQSDTLPQGHGRSPGVGDGGRGERGEMGAVKGAEAAKQGVIAGPELPPCTPAYKTSACVIWLEIAR